MSGMGEGEKISGRGGEGSKNVWEGRGDYIFFLQNNDDEDNDNNNFKMTMIMIFNNNNL